MLSIVLVTLTIVSGEQTTSWTGSLREDTTVSSASSEGTWTDNTQSNRRGKCELCESPSVKIIFFFSHKFCWEGRTCGDVFHSVPRIWHIFEISSLSSLRDRLTFPWKYLIIHRSQYIISFSFSFIQCLEIRQYRMFGKQQFSRHLLHCQRMQGLRRNVLWDLCWQFRSLLCL